MITGLTAGALSAASAIGAASGGAGAFAGLGSGFLSSAVGAGLIGGGISALGGLANTAINSASASHSAHKSYEYSKRLYDYQMRRSLLDAPSMQLEGMRKAGINPMVAYSNLGYHGSMPSFNAPTYSGEIDTSGLGDVIANLPSARSALATQELDRRLSAGKFDLDALNSAVQRSNSTKIANAEVAELSSRSWLNFLKGVSELRMPGKIKAEIAQMYANVQKTLGDTLDPGILRNKVLAETRKLMAERWHGMKSKLYVKPGGPLSSILGVGAEIALGDLIDIGISLGYSAEEILSNVAPEPLKKNDPGVSEVKKPGITRRQMDSLYFKTGIPYQNLEGNSASRLKQSLNFLE